MALMEKLLFGGNSASNEISKLAFKETLNTKNWIYMVRGSLESMQKMTLRQKRRLL